MIIIIFILQQEILHLQQLQLFVQVLIYIVQMYTHAHNQEISLLSGRQAVLLHGKGGVTFSATLEVIPGHPIAFALRQRPVTRFPIYIYVTFPWPLPLIFRCVLSERDGRLD